MTTFYYWLPQERQSTNSAQVLQELCAEGVGYAFDGAITPRGSDKGPDGMRGVVVCAGGDRDGRLGWWPENQEWKRIPSSNVWCGMYTEARPTPDDLARKEQISGEWLLLDDGHRWLAPKARRWREMSDTLMWQHNFPRRLSLSDSGTWELGGVKPKYERLWELATAYEAACAEAVADAGDSDDTIHFAFEEIDTLAVGALQVNYRIGPVEMSMLGIYDMEVRQRLIDVLLDVGTWQAWVKKKLAGQPGGSS